MQAHSREGRHTAESAGTQLREHGHTVERVRAYRTWTHTREGVGTQQTCACALLSLHVLSILRFWRLEIKHKTA